MPATQSPSALARARCFAYMSLSGRRVSRSRWRWSSLLLEDVGEESGTGAFALVEHFLEAVLAATPGTIKDVRW